MAYRRFIKRLVDELAKGEVALKDRIAGYQQRFLRKVGANPNDGSDYRVAEVFATIYAAGKLAQCFGALPKLPGSLTAIVKCYRLHEAERLANKPFGERLQLLLARPDVVRVDRAGLKIKPSKAKKALATVWQTKRGTEVRITNAKISIAFADWDKVSTTEVDRYLRTEGQRSHRHRQPKASLAPGMAKQRLWCFLVPEEWARQS